MPPNACTAATLATGASSGMNTSHGIPVLAGRIGQRLAVVAGAPGDDARGVSEPRDLVHRAAELERARPLQALGLEHDLAAAAAQTGCARSAAACGGRCGRRPSAPRSASPAAIRRATASALAFGAPAGHRARCGGVRRRLAHDQPNVRLLADDSYISCVQACGCMQCRTTVSGPSAAGGGVVANAEVTQRAPRELLADRAYSELRDRIVTLRIAPGAPIDEDALGRELEIGRTPVREAIKRLALENLVTVFPASRHVRLGDQHHRPRRHLRRPHPARGPRRLPCRPADHADPAGGARAAARPSSPTARAATTSTR